MEARDKILVLTIRHKGNYANIYDAITKTEQVSEDDVVDATAMLNKYNVKHLTICDAGYPERLKKVSEPPFVLFYMGDAQLLTSDRLIRLYSDDVAATTFSKRAAIQVALDLAEASFNVITTEVGAAAKVSQTAACRLHIPNVLVLENGLALSPKNYDRMLTDNIILNGGCIVTAAPPTESELQGYECLPNVLSDRRTIFLDTSCRTIQDLEKAGFGSNMPSTVTYAVPHCIFDAEPNGCNDMIAAGLARPYLGMKNNMTNYF